MLMSERTQLWIRAMREGDFDLAWSLSQQALTEQDPGRRNDRSLPHHLRWVWDGSGFDGKRVLVRCHHGLGDTIQFARYLPLLAARCAAVTVEVQPRLEPLFRQLPGIERLIPFHPDDPAPESECDIEITELAFALRASPSSAPPPYLHAPRASLPAGTIGICYSAGDWDPTRSIPPELFRPICEEATCLTLVCEPTGLPVLNPAGCPYDIEHSASLVAAVDLVITADTMIAHLAGAMGRPTWLLLKSDPDWRWSPGATGSPWYPSMRIYSQAEPGDWNTVLSRVSHDLANRVGARGCEAAYDH